MHVNASENIVCEMAAILSKGDELNQHYVYLVPLIWFSSLLPNYPHWADTIFLSFVSDPSSPVTFCQPVSVTTAALLCSLTPSYVAWRLSWSLALSRSLLNILFCAGIVWGDRKSIEGLHTSLHSQLKGDAFGSPSWPKHRDHFNENIIFVILIPWKLHCIHDITYPVAIVNP